MDDPLRPFTRSDAGEAQLREAAERLGPVAEPPSFWSAIANDPSRPGAHRALAVEQLVRRHVHPGGTTLGELAAMLDGAAWLGGGDLTIVRALAGKVPVSWSLDDTVAAVALPGGRRVLYLAVAGRFGAAEIAAALRGKSRDPRVLSAVIREAACVPTG